MTDCKHLTIIGKAEDDNQACAAPHTFAGLLSTLVYRCADCGEPWTGGAYSIPARAAEPPQPSRGMFAVRIDRDGEAYVFRVEPATGTTEMVAIDSVPGVIAFVAASDPGSAAQRAWVTGEAEGLALARLGGKRALEPHASTNAEPPRPASVGGMGTADFPGDWSDLAGINMKAPLVPAEPPHPSNEELVATVRDTLSQVLRLSRLEGHGCQCGDCKKVAALREKLDGDLSELERRLTVKP